MSLLLPQGPPITKQVTIAAGANQLVTNADDSALIAPRNHPVVAMKITALAGNTGKVYLGDSTVTATTGDEIPAGSSVTLDTGSPKQFYVAGTTGDKVSVLLLLAG